MVKILIYWVLNERLKHISHWALNGFLYVLMYSSTTKKMDLLSTQCSNKTFTKLRKYSEFSDIVYSISSASDGPLK